ncbi:TetR/AcrR family transcriptional regulator [Roseateles chitinivorans]|uniref:TetR/AcrR family transcriptional regulator n=1 Tax=Roseateles chitinivorans TaxID=2917965 RepID=UPI003D66C566
MKRVQPAGDDPSPADPSQADINRARILEAAMALIDREGQEAATTRAVAAAAGVQAPTIYRLFGDKRGLLDAVAVHRLNIYVAEKSTRMPDPDPLEELRAGWDLHVAFGLAHPALFAILNGQGTAGATAEITQAGLAVLQRRVRNLALAGRLKTSEARAIDLIKSAGTGTVLTLLSQPDGERDPGLSTAAREAVIAAITGEAGAVSDAGPSAAAAALRASLDQTTALSAGERLLLSELLDRIARGSGS